MASSNEDAGNTAVTVTGFISQLSHALASNKGLIEGGGVRGVGRSHRAGAVGGWVEAGGEVGVRGRDAAVAGVGGGEVRGGARRCGGGLGHGDSGVVGGPRRA